MAQKSDDTDFLEGLYASYKAENLGYDTKGNMKKMNKAIDRIVSNQDTSAVSILIDIYIGYDATNNTVAQNAFLSLVKMGKIIQPELNRRIEKAELQYGINRNSHTDYLDLIALKKRAGLN